METGFPTPALPGWASHHPSPCCSAAKVAGSAVIRAPAPPAPIFMKSRRPRSDTRARVSESFMIVFPLIQDLIGDSGFVLFFLTLISCGMIPLLENHRCSARPPRQVGATCAAQFCETLSRPKSQTSEFSEEVLGGSKMKA